MLSNLLFPFLLTKLISPLSISWPVFLTVKSLSNWPVFPLQPPLYVCIRLRVPRLLRPSYKSPYIYAYQVACTTLIKTLLWVACESPASRLWVERHGAVKAGLCFRCLELCLCFHLVEPSGHRCVAVALLSLLTRSRALRLLKPSSKSPECTRY